MLLETQDLTIWICDIFEIERTPTTFTTDNAPFDFISCRISGKGYFKQNGKIFPYNPGELILSPGNISYSQCCEEDEHLIVIHSKIGGYWPKEIEVIKLYDPEGMTKAFKKMYEAWKSKLPGYRYTCNSIFYKQLAYETSMKEYSSSPALSKIRSSVEYMQKNFSNPNITIHDIAKQSFISDVYFSKLFIKAYKMPAVKYLTEIRINHAKSLIASEVYTFEQVSSLCGFSSYKYFFEVFKRNVGKSPTEFRKENPINYEIMFDGGSPF